MSDTPKERLPGDSAPYEDDDIHIVHSQLLREKDEPSEGFSPVPMLLLFLFGGLVFWGGVYIANYSGDFRWDIYNPEWKPGMTEKVAEKPPLMVTGERLFKNNCQACHQANGAGVPGAFPPLAGSAWVVGDEARIVKILLRGLTGPIEVEGNSYNGNMPSYGENGAGWNDYQIASVSTFVRASWDNGAPEITEEAVAAIRGETADKSGAWSGEEILGAHPL
ncbi:c-type cytochrome [Cerasicoccus maritimus]|uniref:c-type cytochrome n=1 Tax=Cerasicoccus maritimus TaxID=490089 RepID=UPI00285257F7|nr:cytochrome c [Cerasicoccus maritimus]